MKLFGLTLSTLLLLAPGAMAAEYQGKILDGQPFEAQVYQDSSQCSNHSR